MQVLYKNMEYRSRQSHSSIRNRTNEKYRNRMPSVTEYRGGWWSWWKKGGGPNPAPLNHALILHPKDGSGTLLRSTASPYSEFLPAPVPQYANVETLQIRPAFSQIRHQGRVGWVRTNYLFEATLNHPHHTVGTLLREEPRESSLFEHPQVPNGSVVQVLEFRCQEDAAYSQIEYAGLTGYVKSDYLSFTTLSPYACAVSYNLSFATALGRPIGSEREFVEEFCKQEGAKCRANAIRSLMNTQNHLTVVGFQEYRPWANVQEDSIPGIPPGTGNHVITVGPEHLLSSEASVQGMLKTDEVAGVIGVSQYEGSDNTFYSAVMTCWNTGVFGDVQKSVCTNLGNPPDMRPCLVILTKMYLLVNLHAPQPQNYTLESLRVSIDEACRHIGVTTSANLKIIVMGDFNDTNGVIQAQESITILDTRLGLATKNLMTCCYESGYGMIDGTYQFAGDYVLSNLDVVASGIIKSDGKLTQDAGRKGEIHGAPRSDHEPVIAKLRIPPS